MKKKKNWRGEKSERENEEKGEKEKRGKSEKGSTEREKKSPLNKILLYGLICIYVKKRQFFCSFLKEREDNLKRGAIERGQKERKEGGQKKKKFSKRKKKG